MPAAQSMQPLATRDSARFPLSVDQSIRTMCRIFITAGAGMALLSMILAAMRAVDLSQGITGAVTVVILFGVFTLYVRTVRQGEVRVDSEGVTVALKLNVSRMPWSDVAAVRIVTEHPRGLYGLMIRATGSADQHGGIELDLRRVYRIGLRSGTRHGISTGLHRIRFQVADPEAFKAAADARLP